MVNPLSAFVVFPQVSYLASCVCLSNSLKYPRFFRTMPSDALQARAMAKLLQLLGWSWVGLVSADDDYGRFAIQILTEELRGTGVCVAYHQVVPKVKEDTFIFHTFFYTFF